MGKRIVVLSSILLAVFITSIWFSGIPSNASESVLNSCIGKVWVVDDLQLASSAVQPMSFVFTEVGEGSTRGYIRLGYSLAMDYYNGNNLYPKVSEFHGTADKDIAECDFIDIDGKNRRIRFMFIEDGGAEVTLDYGQENEEKYLCRPLNLKDYVPAGEMASTETEMKPWGKVKVVSLAYPYGEMHFGMYVFLVDARNDILYEFRGRQLNGARIIDFYIEDMNGDGMEDMKVITGLWYGDREYGFRFERNYYQTEKGRFLEFDEDEYPAMEEKYCGCYRIAEFLPTPEYPEICEEVMTEQEKDMMLGRVIMMEEEYGIMYDCERRQGLREWRYNFNGNQMVRGFETEGRDRWKAADSAMMRYLEAHGMKEAAGKERYESINGAIFNPLYETVRYYTMEGTDDLIMDSSMTGQYFLLEKLAEGEAEEWKKELSERGRDVLDTGGVTEEEEAGTFRELYGTYTVREFLPTRYYEGKDDTFLPDGEPEWMIGKKVTIGENSFITYDNYRWSYAGKDKEPGKWFQKAEIQEPEYRLTRRKDWETFGLKDDGMLPEGMEQEEYMEVAVYPGLRLGDDRYLPQLFLLDDGRILMYSMGQYFLLEKDG